MHHASFREREQLVLTVPRSNENLPYSKMCPIREYDSQCCGNLAEPRDAGGLSVTFGSRPRVTARWMMACFCSLSSAISFRFARMKLLDAAVRVVEEAHDGGLLIVRRERQVDAREDCRRSGRCPSRMKLPSIGLQRLDVGLSLNRWAK